MANFKMTIRADCAVTAWSFLPPSITALAQWLSGEGVSQPLDRQISTLPPLPPPPLSYLPTSHFPLTASKIKQTSLSTHLSSLLVFEQRAARPPSFGNRRTFGSLSLNLIFKPEFPQPQDGNHTLPSVMSWGSSAIIFVKCSAHRRYSRD